MFAQVAGAFAGVSVCVRLWRAERHSKLNSLLMAVKLELGTTWNERTMGSNLLFFLFNVEKS